eukprot:4364422-Lingulodinium_polyedra.AAC.1
MVGVPASTLRASPCNTAPRPPAKLCAARWAGYRRYLGQMGGLSPAASSSKRTKQPPRRRTP